MIVIRRYIMLYGYNSISAIVSRWAPASDSNNTSAYIREVCRLTGYDKSAKLSWQDKTQICALVYAMAKIESGVRREMEVIQAAYDLCVGGVYT